MLTRFLIAAAAVLAAGSAMAADELPVLAQARHPSGQLVQLHEADGPCTGGAKRATWVSADSQTKIPGCYTVSDGVVKIAWFDSDTSAVPAQVFSKPAGI